MLKSVNFWRSYRQLKKKFSRIIENIDFDPKNEIADKSQKKYFSGQKKNTCLIISIKEQRIWVWLKNKFVSRMDRLNWDRKHQYKSTSYKMQNLYIKSLDISGRIPDLTVGRYIDQPRRQRKVQCKKVVSFVMKVWEDFLCNFTRWI